MTYCVECGTRLESTWKYCPNCGQEKVSPNPVVLPPLGAPAQQHAAAPANAPTQPMVPPPPAIYRPENVGDNRRTQKATERRGRREERKQQKRSKKKIVALLIFLMIAGVAGGFGAKEGIEHNSYRRSIETSQLLQAIEKSENIMVAWQEEIEDVLADPSTAPEAMVSISTKRLAELNAVRKEFTSDGGLEIASWHDDIRAARDRYLAHRDAWESYLKAVARDWRELDDLESLGRINRSFEKACNALRDIDHDTGRYPNRSRNSEAMIAKICVDTGGTPV